MSERGIGSKEFLERNDGVFAGIRYRQKPGITADSEPRRGVPSAGFGLRRVVNRSGEIRSAGAGSPAFPGACAIAGRPLRPGSRKQGDVRGRPPFDRHKSHPGVRACRASPAVPRSEHKSRKLGTLQSSVDLDPCHGVRRGPAPGDDLFRRVTSGPRRYNGVRVRGSANWPALAFWRPSR